MSLASWVNKAWSGSDFWQKDENKKQRQQFAQQAQQQQQARQSQQPGQPQQVNQQQLPTAGAPRRTNVTDVISTLNTPKPQIAPPMQQAPKFNTQAIDQGLNQGKKWEDIAKDTGTNLDQVRQYSQKTRPNYGIKPAGQLDDHQQWQVKRIAQTTPNAPFLTDKDRAAYGAKQFNAINNPNKSAVNTNIREQFYRQSDSDNLDKIVGTAPLTSRDSATKAYEAGLIAQGKGKQLAEARQRVRENNARISAGRNIKSDPLAPATMGNYMSDADALRSVDPRTYQSLERRLDSRKETARSGIDQASNNFLSGFSQTVGKAVPNLANVGFNALDAVSPEGSRVDKFAERMKGFSQAKAQGIENAYQRTGVSQQAGDNPFIAIPSSGIGQIASTIATGGTASGIGTGADVFGSSQRDMLSKGVDDETRQIMTALPNAVIQGILEKVGVDNLTTTAGKTLLKRLFFKAASEGSQEASQELVGNIAARTYDKNQNIWENVPQSAGWGALLGGATGLALDSPNIANDMSQKWNNRTPMGQDGFFRVPGRPGSNQTQQAPTKTGLPHTGEVAILSDYQESLLGKLPLSLTNQTHAAARNIAQQYGLDVTSGSPYEINNRINNFIENGMPQAPKPPSFFNTAKDRLKLQNDGGYIAGPLALDFSKAKADGKVFDGVDGKPRFEVDDSGAKVIAKRDGYGYDLGNGTPLKDVLDHPELYKQYPDLKNVKVRVDENLNSGEAAYLDGQDIVEVAPDARPDTILHEVQHAIQQRENFAKGGEVADSIDRQRLQKEIPELSTWQKRLREINDVKLENDGQGRAGMTREQRSALAQEQRALERQMSKAEYGVALKDYRNLAGEAEARAVQARMNMPDGERYVPNENLGQKEAYTPEYNQMAERNRLAAEPFDYDLMRTHFNVNPEVKGNKVKVYRLTDAKTGELLPGDNVSYAPVKDVDYITAAKMGITKIINNPKYKQIEQWIPKKDLYQTPAGTQIYAPNGLKTSAKRSTFYDSLDVPKKDLIIRNSDGKAMSIDPKPDAEAQLEKFYGQGGDQDFLVGIIEKYKGKVNTGESIVPLLTKAEKARYDEIYSGKAMSLGGKKFLKDKLAPVQAEPTVTPQGAIPAPVKPDTAYSDMQRGLNAQEQAKGTKNSSPRSQSLKEALQQPQQTGGRLSTSQGVGDTSKSSNSQLDQRIQQRKEQIKNREQNTSNTNVPQTLNEFDKAIGGTGDIESQIQDKSVTQRANSAETKKLMEAISQDDIITKAAAEAQQSGKEINFYAEKDANGRSVGIKRFDPRSNMIQSGFVTDKNGNTLGNHIKVDPTGLQVNVGGEMVNIGSMLGDVTKLGNNFKISSTMERNIRDNAPKEVADKLYKYTVANKIQNESNFKTELANERASLRERTKQTMKAKPRGVSHTDYKADIFDYIEGNKSQTDLMGKYNTAELKTIDNYAKSTRNLYDSLLSRANTEFEKYGLPTVMPRKDYITHINELMNKQSFVGEVAGQLQGGIADEGKQTTRGAVPGNIAGRTEGFKPSKQWNRFFQERKGGAFSKDPFKAVDAYLEPTLHNIHMTESGVRARAVESALRTASELKEMNTTKVSSELSDSLAKFKAQGGNNELVRGFQEYANAITGKTQAFDRQIIDSGKGPALALKGWQKLQKIGGQATILGNVNSVLMQPLNQVGTLAQGGVKNYLKGTVASITGNKAIDSSPFITARQAKTDKVFKSKGQKVMDTGAVPLEILEMASVKNAWNVMHEQVKSEGIKGQDAIIETDRRTERLVAGRGIADRPELYRSTAANGVLQYTLEVNAQNKQFWHDLSPKQKATFMIATTGVNSILGAVTGNAPLPDFLKAMFDSVMDFADTSKDGSAIAKTGRAAQRIAGEAASMNPLVSAGANLLPKGVRQGMFGKESDLGRYDGTAAPVQVVKNAYDTVSNLAKGEFDKAANSALRTVPFGNQARKTKAGYQLLASGDVEVNPWNATRALAFGPNAIKDKPEYGSSNRISSSKGAVNASSVANKGSNSLGKAGDVDSILKGQFNTKEGKQFLSMKEADKKAAAESDPEMKKMYDQYKTTKRINAANPDRPDGLSKESANVLNWDKKRTVAQKEKLKYSQNDYDYKLTKAKYEQEKLNGTLSRAEEINKKQSLKKAEIGSKFSKDTRESYDSLSKQELLDLVSNDPNGKAMYEKALAYGDALVKAGLTKKNKLRTGGSGGGKGKGGGGKKGNSAAGVSSLLAMMKAGAAIKPPTTPKAPAIQAKKSTAVKLKKYAGAKSGKVSAPKISSRKGIKYA